MLKLLKKLLLSSLLLLMCACNTGKQYVAYTIYPIGYLLNRIGGNKIEPISIQSNDIVQTAQLLDNYAEILADSSVLFHIGDLEPYMDIYEEEIKDLGINLSAGDLSVLNCLYEYKRYQPIYVDNNKVSFVEGPYYDGETFNEIDTYDLDPFIWLSPSGMYSMAKDIYDYLSANYVEQSEYFRNNYEVLADELIALDASYQAMASRLLKENKMIKFVAMSGSFGCWQKDINVQVYPICLSKYGGMPSQEQLEIIKAKIINDNVKYIVYEPNMSKEMTELFSQLEIELGLKRVNMNNISSLSDKQINNGETYTSLMYKNLSALETMATPIYQNVEPTDNQETEE